jgi:hypothetical protein
MNNRSILSFGRRVYLIAEESTRPYSSISSLSFVPLLSFPSASFFFIFSFCTCLVFLPPHPVVTLFVLIFFYETTSQLPTNLSTLYSPKHHRNLPPPWKPINPISPSSPPLPVINNRPYNNILHGSHQHPLSRPRL